jgi:hypothetical protein
MSRKRPLTKGVLFAPQRHGCSGRREKIPKQATRDKPFQNQLGEDNEDTFTWDAYIPQIALPAGADDKRSSWHEARRCLSWLTNASHKRRRRTVFLY